MSWNATSSNSVLEAGLVVPMRSSTARPANLLAFGPSD